MVKPLAVKRVTKKRPKAPKRNVRRGVTPIIYYGGKTRDASWIINQFPEHKVFVDVFGGGGSISFAKHPSELDVYNDIGNVVIFMECLQKYGDELYESLYHTTWSRQWFYEAVERWKEISDEIIAASKKSDTPYREAFKLDKEKMVEFARAWYTVIIQGFTHEEKSDSWKPSKTVDLAFPWRNHIESLPQFTDRLTRITIENRDFKDIIARYDSHDTLFYCDPPYMVATRASQGNYMNEMTYARHYELLTQLNGIKGQSLVSMYSEPLYEKELKDWRRLEITHRSAILNTSGQKDAGERTEVLWIKEHQRSLWSSLYEDEPSDVSRLSQDELEQEELSSIGED